MGNIASGGAAGGISIMVVYPLDFVRTRLAADVGRKKDREFKGAIDCCNKIMKSDGITGFYRGINVAFWGMIAYRGWYFGMYDTGKTYLWEDYKKASLLEVSMFAQFVTGSASIIFYPFDTVRRRLMMNSGREKGEAKLYDNSIDCMRKIYKNEGPLAFYKGCLSNLIRSMGGGFVLVLYDKMG